jgi:hypothetical protein
MDIKYQSDRQLILSLLYKEDIDKSYIEYIYNSIPESTEKFDTGWLHVDDVKKSKSILKKHIGNDLYFRNYPTSFLISSPSFAQDGHMRNFDCYDLKSYIQKLVDAGVIIHNFSFSNLDDHLCFNI